MRARFQADADLRFGIVRALCIREPTLDFQAAQGVIRDSTSDPEVLALASDAGRVLVSHDFETMPGHFYRFLESRESPGLILLPQLWPLGRAVEEIQIAWLCQEADEFRNRILYLPL